MFILYNDIESLFYVMFYCIFSIKFMIIYLDIQHSIEYKQLFDTEPLLLDVYSRNVLARVIQAELLF